MFNQPHYRRKEAERKELHNRQAKKRKLAPPLIYLMLMLPNEMDSQSPCFISGSNLAAATITYKRVINQNITNNGEWKENNNDSYYLKCCLNAHKMNASLLSRKKSSITSSMPR
jgi:hypothetical protein